MRITLNWGHAMVAVFFLFAVYAYAGGVRKWGWNWMWSDGSEKFCRDLYERS